MTLEGGAFKRRTVVTHSGTIVTSAAAASTLATAATATDAVDAVAAASQQPTRGDSAAADDDLNNAMVNSKCQPAAPSRPPVSNT